MKKTNGVNWCGPWALAFLTDRTYEAADMLARKKANRKNKIQNMTTRVMERCLGTKTFTRHSNMTVTRAMDNLLPGRIYLLWVTRHYLILDTGTGMIIHNQEPTWKPISECRYRRTQVRGSICWTPRKAGAEKFRLKKGLDK